MDDVLGVVCTVLACADIAAFTLLLCRPMKKISGAGGLKGTLIGLAMSAAFTAVVVIALRREIKDALASHKAAAAVLYSSLLAAIVCMIALLYRKRSAVTLEDLDSMDGKAFENACAKMLLANDFENIKQTKASGDFGVDILAEREGLLYGVQCKRYNTKLDSRPIQEISAGMAYYECDVGAVMTNSVFTKHAAELADAGSIELWDRDTLAEWVKMLE